MIPTAFEVLAINFAEALVGYLLFAGAAAGWIAWSASGRQSGRRINPRPVREGQVRAEVIASIRSCLIFAAGVVATWWLGVKGWNQLYWDFERHGTGWFVVSVVLTFVLWDAWFYWTHRAMHHPALFRLFHKTHHRSNATTPWTTYAFDPLESLAYALFLPLVVFLYPFHPLALVAFMTLQLAWNVVIHLGIEVFPARFAGSRLSWFVSSATSHAMHHQHNRGNYGFFFQWWDRAMGTAHPDYDRRLTELSAAPRVVSTPDFRGRETG